MTDEKIKSKDSWAVQGIRSQERRAGFQTRNIAAVGNPPDISCFSSETLLSISTGRKRTTSTSSGRYRRRPRMAGRKDREK